MVFLHIPHGLMNTPGSPGSSLTLLAKERKGEDYVEKQRKTDRNVPPLVSMMNLFPNMVGEKF